MQQSAFFVSKDWRGLENIRVNKVTSAVMYCKYRWIVLVKFGGQSQGQTHRVMVRSTQRCLMINCV